MGNLWVHERMKECCQTTLEKLDRARSAGLRAAGARAPAGAKSEATLVQELGSLPIPEATLAAQRLHDLRSPLLQVGGLAKEKWDAIVEKHHEKHQGAGETREALFWRVLAGPPGPVST